MAVDFNGGLVADRVEVSADASHDWGTGSFTIHQWLVNNAANDLDRLWFKSDVTSDVQALLLSSGDLVFSVPRATTGGWRQSASALGTGVLFLAFTFDTTNGPRIYQGNLTTLATEIAYGAGGEDVAGAGTPADVDGNPFIIGNSDEGNDAFDGEISRTIVYPGVAHTEAQIQARQFFPWLESDMGVGVDLYGLTGNVDFSGNGNVFTAFSGAAQVRHIPLPMAVGGSNVIASQKGAITAAIGQATESDTAQSVTALKTRAIGQSAEADSAQAINAAKSELVGQVSEADVAQPVSYGIAIQIAQVTESDSVQSVTAAKTEVVGQSSEVGSALSLTALKSKAIGQIEESHEAAGIPALKTVALSQVTESDTSQAITAPIVRQVGQVLESDSVQSVASLKAQLMGQVAESDEAQTIGTGGAILTGQVAESNQAQPLTVVKVLDVSQATEAALAQALTSGKSLSFGQISETDLAQPISLAGANSNAAVVALSGVFNNQIELTGVWPT